MHYGKKTDKFETYRLAAGIWAGDQNGLDRLDDVIAVGNNLSGVDERMSALLNDEIHAVIYLTDDGVMFLGPSGLGKDAVQQSKGFNVAQIPVTISLDFLGQAMQYLLNLSLLCLIGILQIVVVRYQFCRFYISRLTGRRLPVLQSLYGILVVILDEYDASVVSLGYDVILQILAVSGHVLSQA